MAVASSFGIFFSLINSPRAGFVAEPNDVNSVKGLLYELYERYKKGTLRIDPDQQEVGKYDRKILTGKLAHVFDEILRARDEEG